MQFADIPKPVVITLEESGLASDSIYWPSIVANNRTPILSAISEVTADESEVLHSYTTNLQVELTKTDADGNTTPSVGVIEVNINPAILNNKPAQNGIISVASEPPVKRDQEIYSGDLGTTLNFRDYGLDSFDEAYLPPETVIEIRYDADGNVIELRIQEPSDVSVQPKKSGKVNFKLIFIYPEGAKFDNVLVGITGLPFTFDMTNAFTTETDAVMYHLDPSDNTDFSYDIPFKVGMRALKPPKYLHISA